MGFSMPISYRRRKEEKGANAARRYIFIRYLLLLVLGLVIANIDLQFIQYYSLRFGGDLRSIATLIPDDHPIVYILSWDLIASIAVAGLVGLLFLGVRNPRYRFFLGYGWAFLYHIGLYSTNMEIIALQSVNGGFLTAFMGYGSIVIIATAMGDNFFFTDTVEAKRLRGLLLFGGVNLIITVILSWLASTGRVINAFNLDSSLASLPFIMTAVGASSLFIWAFYQAQNRLKWNLKFLKMFGANAFLLYFIAVLPDILFERIFGLLGYDTTSIPWYFSLIWAILLIFITTFTAWQMYKKDKRISTVKSSLLFLVSIVAVLIIVVILEVSGINIVAGI
jgi:hypothetical protein